MQGTTLVGVVGSGPGSVGVAASVDDLGAVAEEAEPGPVTPSESDSRLRRILSLCLLLSSVAERSRDRSLSSSSSKKDCVKSGLGILTLCAQQLWRVLRRNMIEWDGVNQGKGRWTDEQRERAKGIRPLLKPPPLPPIIHTSVPGGLRA